MGQEVHLFPAAVKEDCLWRILVQGSGALLAGDLNKRIAAEVSWSRTSDRAARTKPARDRFLARFEHEVDPEGRLTPAVRRQRAEHARRAYMLRLANRSAQARQRRKTGEASR